MKNYLLKVLILVIYVSFGTLAFSQNVRNEISGGINLAGFIQKTPVISLDGKTLVFVSNQKGKWQIFESKLNASGVWASPIAIDAINQKISATGVIEGLSLTNSAQVLYFAANIEGTLGDCDIFSTENVNGVWQAPKNLGEMINTTGFDGEPSISSDGSSLYFTRANLASEDKDHTCRIIYLSQKDGEGKWSKPLPLPSPVNLGCELAPRIMHDNKTLLLSSLREGKKDAKGEFIEKPKGEFDIYLAQMLAKNVWSEPILINELSSLESDLYACTDAASKNMIWSVTTKIKNVPMGKIYTAPMPTSVQVGKNMLITGKITDLKSTQAIAGTLKLIDPTTSRLIYQVTNNSTDGSFQLFLNQGKNYKIEAMNGDYSHFFFYENLVDLKSNVVKEQNIQLYHEIRLLLNVFDKEIFEALDCAITVTDESGFQIEFKVENVAKGRYYITLPLGKKYMVSAHKKNFFPDGITLDLRDVIQFDEFEKDVELEPQKREMEIDISDQQSSEGIETEIVITNMDKKETIVVKAEKGKNGKYTIKLREGDKYEVNVKNPKGYAYYNTKVDLNSDQETKKLDVKLTPLKVETNFTLNDITFETNSADLNASSFGELDRAVLLLKDNPDLKIEIAAHSDDIGSDAFNLKLSDKRAKSVVEYMVEKGLPILRLVSKGYGESMPLVPNTSDENRAKNRRVMLKILGFTTNK